MNEKTDLCKITTISQEKVVVNVPLKTSKPLITIKEGKQIKPSKLHCNILKGSDSIMDSVDTGFGSSNLVIVDCPKPKYKSHLCKENYLGEFKLETEKKLARNNLGVYSKEEIDLIVGNIIIENGGFVTKSQVLKMINEADFVNSTLRSYTDYQIPDSLFKL